MILFRLLQGKAAAWLMLAALAAEQICLSASLYLKLGCMVQLTQRDLSQIQQAILGMLLLWLLACLLDLSLYLSIFRLFQQLYRSYQSSLLQSLLKKGPVFSTKQKEEVFSYVSGEAFLTFRELTVFPLYLGFSVLNPTLAFLVFYQRLGGKLTLGLALILVLSLLFMLAFRGMLEKRTKQLQRSRVDFFEAVHRFWDPLFFGAREKAPSITHSLEQKIDWIGCVERQVALMNHFFSFIPLLLAGVLLDIAPLPTSRYGLILLLLPDLYGLMNDIPLLVEGVSGLWSTEARLRELFQFPERLTAVPLASRISSAALKIQETISAQTFPGTPEDFLEALSARTITSGRWSIFGVNGAGKSSLLLWIKSRHPEAWLIAPDIQLFEKPEAASTGEAQLHQLVNLFNSSTPPSLFLLDEWGAHLDAKNRALWEKRLSEASKKHLIIEVQHQPPSSG